MVFASTPLLQERTLLDDIRKAYPKAVLLGCSTAGEIEGTKGFGQLIGPYCSSLRTYRTTPGFNTNLWSGGQLPGWREARQGIEQ
jgi:hypothetical protein